MATYVRACDASALRKLVEATGRHADVAFRAGISPVRLSQILGGASPVIPLQQAAKLEDVLGVPHGTLFVLDDPGASELIGPYLPRPDVEGDGAETGAA
ncbi:helix-turn-helix domain-containing protein [Saccharopolyspora phatthalungensis]|uniref:Transcriptional regulator with XRE-family HTH domain n=1 Tax=Saccharopolyspora phatthalungensis TaxID=664693 RepID=A0A840Q8Q7_9PSEU|nr:helix-turn-helix transcriptional regulator [Saccharopolyspora phatthalungensis]MBB5154999.1 transcriptional regulator with XRE-family HTH domain [Saccharopolyspora phatthalungensis]